LTLAERSKVPLTLVMASANPQKVGQMNDLLAALLPGTVVLARPASVGDVVEDAGSLLGNARLKARAIAVATQQLAVADDTGLFVQALDGAPGVETAYYAGPANDAEANMSKLLAELQRVGAMSFEQRRAQFRTVALVCDPDGNEVFGEGVIDGTVCLERRGNQGFGYDPLFLPDGDTETLAEMDYERKQGLSHRYRAFVALSERLRVHQWL
jgi:XTP/dITP diphosphohydrolase